MRGSPPRGPGAEPLVGNRGSELAAIKSSSAILVSRKISFMRIFAGVTDDLE